MTAARDEILDRVRRALADRPAPAPVVRDYRTTGTSGAAVLDLLAERLVDYRAAVRRVAGHDEIGSAVAAALEDRGATRTAVPPGLPDAWVPAGAVCDDGRLTPAGLDALDGIVTACTVAIAETGTLVLDHAAADQGRRALTLVPDYHLVVVLADQCVSGVPEALGRLDPDHPQTWISGPSATSDIELDRVEGVHGPRTLEVLLVG